MRQAVILAIVIGAVCTTWTDAAQTETFDVATFITSRFAETTITSQVKNELEVNQEIQFQFLLPKEAFISAFSLTINGITYDAEVEEKVKAEKAFQAAKQRNKTAGLVSTRKESTKTFKTSVNVAAGEIVEFRLVYQQLLRRIRGKYNHQIILLGSQLTDLLTINVFICESQPITEVIVPPILTSDGKKITPKVMVNREKNSAHVEYLQGENDEMLTSLASSGGSFEVVYALEPTLEAGQIVLNNGYFAYFFAPDVNIEPRRVVFTLDVSGSMYGGKIAQLKEAMINIIDKLTEEDRFSVITFQDTITVWQNSETLYEGTRENIKSAQEFIRNMRATGGTNVNLALKTALKILHQDIGSVSKVDSKSNYVVFLTDGQPTSGETADDKILHNVDVSNKRNLAIHAVGFGRSVDTDFLKSLAARNQGTWTQILVDINAALQIQNYLDELSVSLLKDIIIDYPADIVDEFIMQPEEQFHAGGEIIAFGRFKEGIDPRNRGPHAVEISGVAGGEIQLKLEFFLDQKEPTCEAVKGNVVHEFGNKAFGLTNVVEVLRQYDAETDVTLKEELKEKAINMSISYGLVTPVTSLLVIKPGDKKIIEEQLAANKVAATATPTPGAPVTYTAPRTTIPSWGLQGDPHFIIKLTKTITTCFNWMGRSGEVFNLLNDPARNIVINGLVEGDGNKPGVDHAIFVTKLVILLGKENLVITINAREVVVRDTSNTKKRMRDLRLPMVNMEDYKATYGHVTFRVSDVNLAHTILNVSIGNEISFIVNLHHYSTYQPGQIDHLDLLITGSEKLSSKLGGVFGRFPRDHTIETNAASIEKKGTSTLLWFNDEVIPVKRTAMSVPYVHRKVECWFVAKPASILGASLESFKLKSLMEIPKRLIGRH